MSNDLYSQQAEGIRIYSKVVTPECFYRGSSSNIPWIPLRQAQCGEPSRATAKSMRE